MIQSCAPAVVGGRGVTWGRLAGNVRRGATSARSHPPAHAPARSSTQQYAAARSSAAPPPPPPPPLTLDEIVDDLAVPEEAGRGALPPRRGAVERARRRDLLRRQRHVVRVGEVELVLREGGVEELEVAVLIALLHRRQAAARREEGDQRDPRRLAKVDVGEPGEPRVGRHDQRNEGAREQAVEAEHGLDRYHAAALALLPIAVDHRDVELRRGAPVIADQARARVASLGGRRGGRTVAYVSRRRRGVGSGRAARIRERGGVGGGAVSAGGGREAGGWRGEDPTTKSHTCSRMTRSSNNRNTRAMEL